MDQDSVTFGRMPDPGQVVSLRDLYDATHPRLVLQVSSADGDVEAAERAVREAFVRAVAAGWRFWRASDPEAWLRTTATRVRRRSRRRTRAGPPTAAGEPSPLPRAGPERLAPPPPFELIEAAGLARRRRRHAVAGVVATCVLAIAAVLSETDGSSGPGPSGAATSAGAHRGPWMATPRSGTYELTPWPDRPLPVVQVTVPTPWSAWLGPGRSDGLDVRVADDELVLLDDHGGHAGLLAASVTSIAQRDCTASDVTDAGTTSFVRTLAHAPRLAVTDGPRRTVRAGLPAVRLRLRTLGRPLACPRLPLFTTSQGQVTGGPGGTTYDAWVVDVDGEPLLVWVGWTHGSPPSDVAVLHQIVDSLVLRDPDGQP